MLGLPFAFASHFAPERAAATRCEIYRERFEPSEQLDRPYAMVACNVIAADTEAEARRLFTSPQQSFVNLVRGTRGQLRAADRRHRGLLVAGGKGACLAHARLLLRRDRRRRSPTGCTASSRRPGADELIVAAAIYDHAARLRSYEILAEAMRAALSGQARARPERNLAIAAGVRPIDLGATPKK